MDTPNALTIFAITCRASWFFLLPLFESEAQTLLVSQLHYQKHPSTRVCDADMVHKCKAVIE